MNIDRPCADGKPRNEEVLNKSQVYVTTAGYKSTFAYNKLIQLLIRMVIEPDKAFVMGGTYRTPVAAGLIPRDFVEELKRDGGERHKKLFQFVTGVFEIYFLKANEEA